MKKTATKEATPAELPTGVKANQQLACTLDSIGCQVGYLYYVAAFGKRTTPLTDQLCAEPLDKLVKQISPAFEKLKDKRVTSQGIVDFLWEEKLLGYIALVQMPVQQDFRYDDKGGIVYYKRLPALLYCFYVYGETMEQLVNNIKPTAERMQQGWADKEKTSATNRKTSYKQRKIK